MSALMLMNKGCESGHVSNPAVDVLTVFFTAVLYRREFTEDVAVWHKPGQKIPLKFTVAFEVESQKRRESEL